MKFAPARFKQTELSDSEKAALRGVAEGGPIALLLGKRLQKLGLVEKTHAGGPSLTRGTFA
jgi:hypothetical protein